MGEALQGGSQGRGLRGSRFTGPGALSGTLRGRVVRGARAFSGSTALGGGPAGGSGGLGRGGGAAGRGASGSAAWGRGASKGTVPGARRGRSGAGGRGAAADAWWGSVAGGGVPSGERGSTRGSPAPAPPEEAASLTEEARASPTDERHDVTHRPGTARGARTALTHSGHQTGHSPHPRLAWSTCEAPAPSIRPGAGPSIDPSAGPHTTPGSAPRAPSPTPTPPPPERSLTHGSS